MIDNNHRGRKIFNRIMTIMVAFLIHKAIITVAVVVSKGYISNGNLFSLESFKDILFFNFSKWDSNWYLKIAENGYYSTKSTAFFPLYPILIRVLSDITNLNPVICGIIISSICFLIALYFAQKLIEIDFDSRAAKRVVYILALNPVAFYFTSVYTESTFLMLSILCLYNIRKRRWFLAAMAGAFCSATRNTGVLLVIPFALEYFYAKLPLQVIGENYSIKDRLIGVKNELKISNVNKYLSGLWICLVPLGLISYMSYLFLKFGSALTFISSQSDYGRSTLNPIKSIVVGLWVTLKLAISKYGYGNQIYYIFEFISVLNFVVLSIICFRKMRFSYWMLMVISLLIPLTKPALTSTVTDYFVSFPRYLIVSFPYMLSLYMISKKNNVIYGVIISLSIVILILSVYFWSIKLWVA